MIFPIVFGFIYHVTEYKKSPEMIMLHTLYSSLLNGGVFGSWKRKWTSKKLRANGAEVPEFTKEVSIYFVLSALQEYT